MPLDSDVRVVNDLEAGCSAEVVIVAGGLSILLGCWGKIDF